MFHFQNLDKLEAKALTVIQILNSAFKECPSKLADFQGFLEIYRHHVEYYKYNIDRLMDEAMDEEEVVDKNQPGPAPPPRALTPEGDEAMETEENTQEESAEQKRKAAEAGVQHIQKGFNDLVSNMLTDVCEGQPSLMAATIEFLPYLGRAIEKGGPAVADVSFYKVQTLIPTFSENHRHTQISSNGYRR